jgi:hypothetical protein
VRRRASSPPPHRHRAAGASPHRHRAAGASPRRRPPRSRRPSPSPSRRGSRHCRDGGARGSECGRARCGRARRGGSVRPGSVRPRARLVPSPPGIRPTRRIGVVGRGHRAVLPNANPGSVSLNRPAPHAGTSLGSRFGTVAPPASHRRPDPVRLSGRPAARPSGASARSPDRSPPGAATMAATPHLGRPARVLAEGRVGDRAGLRREGRGPARSPGRGLFSVVRSCVPAALRPSHVRGG